MNKSIQNLNQLRPNEKDAYQGRLDLIKSNNVTVHFDHIQTRLIDYIRNADIIVGCVAWLTNFQIIEALATKKTQIIIQKEDFLRPDISISKNWTQKLRMLYKKLEKIHRFEFFDYEVSSHWDPANDAIRCVGNHNKDKKPAFPRMHNKFLVFCKRGEETSVSADEKYREWEKEFIKKFNECKQEHDRCVECEECNTFYRNFGHELYIKRQEFDQKILPKPYAVWTGSFNFTENAARSFENAVYIQDDEIAKGYYREWQHIFLLSEPLDWKSVWCTPEYHIGS